MPAKGRKGISSVAAELLVSRRAGTGTALYLGAGASLTSGVPLWEALASDILSRLAVDVDGDGLESAVETLEEHLTRNPGTSDLVTNIIDLELAQARPSSGYKYLARLAAAGFYKTIVTMNWDFLLEECLHQVMQPHQILVLSRDQHSDEYIAEALENQTDRLVVFRLHGDTRGRLRMGDNRNTREVPDEIRTALSRRLRRVHAVGYSGRDTDVLSTLFAALKGIDLLLVTPDLADVNTTLRDLSTSHVTGEHPVSPSAKNGEVADKVNLGEFDHFFCQLALEVERRLLKEADRRKRLNEIEKTLLRKEEAGLSYINASQLTQLVDRFAAEVMRLRTPEIVFFVNDPSAPGGMEVKKRIQEHLIDKGVEVAELLIQGEGDNRSFKRSFQGERLDEDKKVKLVHVVDSITFSGNTLEIAREEVRTWYPNADVRIGALVVSQMLINKEDELGTPDTKRIYHEGVTDRFEIFFPWGVTQTTADFDRTFPGVDSDRVVNIVRRPWGAIEVLADQEQCSVRLLTIEAHRRLSFQRHLMRDELFVALDDNIGIDLCATELGPTATPFDPAVKSMVLEKGDYILIPRGVWHRTKASMDRARLLEVGFGLYDQRYDIERLFDDFDRTHSDGGQ